MSELFGRNRKNRNSGASSAHSRISHLTSARWQIFLQANIKSKIEPLLHKYLFDINHFSSIHHQLLLLVLLLYDLIQLLPLPLVFSCLRCTPGNFYIGSERHCPQPADIVIGQTAINWWLLSYFPPKNSFLWIPNILFIFWWLLLLPQTNFFRFCGLHSA